MTPEVKGALAPHQQRVVEEKTELDVKREKLFTFFGSSTFAALPWPERERLIAQSNVMTLYSAILGDRIAAFS